MPLRRALPPVLAALCALALSACAPMAPSAAAPRTSFCEAEAARWAIGRAADQELINRVLHDTGSRTARVLGPGEAATMDYRPERVSILVNERGAITGIKCG